MAGFELIVRPMILPGIRPAPRPSVVPAEGDPEKGLVVIRGSSARTVDLPYSYSSHWEVVMASEVERSYDVARVYQQEGQEGGSATRSGREGEVNRSNYFDVEVVRRLRMQEGGTEVDYHFTPIQASDNVKILKTNLVRRR
jgi:hypothetical protein